MFLPVLEFSFGSHIKSTGKRSFQYISLRNLLHSWEKKKKKSHPEIITCFHAHKLLRYPAFIQSYCFFKTIQTLSSLDNMKEEFLNGGSFLLESWHHMIKKPNFSRSSHFKISLSKKPSAKLSFMWLHGALFPQAQFCKFDLVLLMHVISVFTLFFVFFEKEKTCYAHSIETINMAEKKKNQTDFLSFSFTCSRWSLKY